MAVNDFENRLTQELKKYIRTNHNETGSLANSARVVINGPNDISIVANDYIQYLDDGNFIDAFFELPNTISILEEYTVFVIEENPKDDIPS